MNNKINVVDLLELDHNLLKEYCKVLTDEKEKKTKKMTIANLFLKTIVSHSQSEEVVVYNQLKNLPDFRSTIIEGEIEHGLIDSKTKSIKKILKNTTTLDDVTEVELKVLSELVQHHIKEEEKDLFPKMKKLLDSDKLNELGIKYARIRKFTEKELKDHRTIKDKIEELVSNGLKTIDEYLKDSK